MLTLLLASTLMVAATAQAQTTWCVDDDAPNDPGPGDPMITDPNESCGIDDVLVVGDEGALSGSPTPRPFTFTVTVTNVSPCQTAAGVRLSLDEFATAADVGGRKRRYLAGFSGRDGGRPGRDGSRHQCDLWLVYDSRCADEGAEFSVESPNMPVDLGDLGPGESNTVNVVIQGTPYLVDSYVGGVVTTGS